MVTIKWPLTVDELIDVVSSAGGFSPGKTSVIRRIDTDKTKLLEQATWN